MHGVKERPGARIQRGTAPPPDPVVGRADEQHAAGPRLGQVHHGRRVFGELAEPLFTLTQRLVRAALLGFVHDDRDVAETGTTRPDRRRPDAPPEVGPQETPGARIRFARAGGGTPLGLQAITILGMHAGHPAITQRLVQGHAQHAQRGVIGVSHATIGRHHRDARGRGFRHRAKLRFALAQCALHTQAARDVLDNGETGGPIEIGHRARVNGHLKPRAILAPVGGALHGNFGLAQCHEPIDHRPFLGYSKVPDGEFGELIVRVAVLLKSGLIGFNEPQCFVLKDPGRERTAFKERQQAHTILLAGRQGPPKRP